MTRAHCLWRIALLACLSACLDVAPRDTSGTELTWPRVRSIDRFEKEERTPDWNLLFPWTCQHWPDVAPLTCGRVEPGAGGEGHAQFLDFDLTSRNPDDFQSAALHSHRAGIRIDLSSYDRISFRAKVSARNPGDLPADFELRASLGCGRAMNGVDSTSIESALNPPTDGNWRTYVIDLDAFVSAPWDAPERYDPTECLHHVEYLAFVLGAGSLVSTPDRHAVGRFEIDDIELLTNGGALAGSDSLQFTPWACYGYGGGADQPVCDISQPAPSMTFAVDFQSAERTAAMASSPKKVDTVSRQEQLEILDLTGFRSLAFSAQFEPDDSAEQPSGRFQVKLECNNLLPTPNSGVGVVRDVEVFPAWSSYVLPLSSFRGTEYPLGFNDLTGCLAKVDVLTFSTQLDPGETSSGTLRIDRVVLR